MLTEANDLIVAQIETITGLKKVGEWAGEVEALIKSAKTMPAAYVIYGGGLFGPAPAALGSSLVEDIDTWTVILLSKNLRSRGSSALECYSYIEQIRAKLTKFAVGDGWLWPVRCELLLAQKGSLAYGLDFTLETEV